MKIALFQGKPQHTETFGAFIEIILKNKLPIKLFDIYYNFNDIISYVDYFRTIYDGINNIYDYKLFENNIENYDVIIMTTSLDLLGHDIAKKYRNKIIFVNHLKTHNRPYMKLNLVFSPFLCEQMNTNSISNYMLPLYKTKIEQKIKKNIILVIGNLFFRDMNFIKKLNDFHYSVVVVTRNIILAKQLQNYDNIIVHHNIRVTDLFEIISECKYILSVPINDGEYYHSRFTGEIALAINHNIPLIIPTQLNKIYNLTGVIQYDNYDNMINKLIHCPKSRYDQLVDQIVQLKNIKIAQNKKIFNEYVNMINLYSDVSSSREFDIYIYMDKYLKNLNINKKLIINNKNDINKNLLDRVDFILLRIDFNEIEFINTLNKLNYNGIIGMNSKYSDLAKKYLSVKCDSYDNFDFFQKK
jgi:hypothetical protein